MRRSLYKKNYALLKKFAPEILQDPAPVFLLDHKAVTGPYANVSAERLDNNLVCIGTFYSVNGDIISDPAITVLFDNEQKIARVSELYIGNPGMSMLGGPIYNTFDCTLGSEETDTEREANDYLNYWLTSFAASRRDDPNYFNKIPL